MNQTHNFKKHFGQNFLKSQKSIDKFVQCMDLQLGDFVIEIGPGDGQITKGLIKNSARVVSVEIDSELVDPLVNQFGNFENWELVHEDILQFDINKFLKDKGIEKFKVVGSLPYNISKRIIHKFASLEKRPDLMCFILQKEVAEDYAALPPRSSFLYHAYRPIFEIAYRSKINKSYFTPKPKVDGGIITFKLLEKPMVKFENFLKYTKFVKNAYSQPRKKLLKVIKGVYKDCNWEEIFEKIGIDKNARAAELEVEEFVGLFGFLVF